MLAVYVRETREQLSSLLDAVAAGEEIIILRNGRPAARLTAPETEVTPFQRTIHWISSRKTALRTLDALHPACAEHHRSRLITEDKRLLEAAGFAAPPSVFSRLQTPVSIAPADHRTLHRPD